MALNLKQLKKLKKSGDASQRQLERLKNLRQKNQAASATPGAGTSLTGPTTSASSGTAAPQVRPLSLNEGSEDIGAGVINAGREQLPSVTQQAFKPLDFGSLPEAPQTQDLAAERNRIEDSLFSRYTKNFDQDKATELDALRQNLAERGISPGSGTLYQNEMNRFEDQWNQRYDDAKSRAVEAGGAEFERSFGIGRLGRSDALGEQILGTQHPLQQLTGLLGLADPSLNYQLSLQQLAQQKSLSDADRKSAEKIAKQGNQTSKYIANLGRGGGGGAAATPPDLSPPLPPPPGAF